MMAFREMGDDDVEPLVSLWKACGLTRPWNDPYKDISFARQGSASTVLVGEMDGTIVAAIMAGHDGHRGMFYYLAVDPSKRKQGLGRQAVRAAESWLAERGVWKVNLLVRPENATVKGFYEALGYDFNPVICMSRKIAGRASCLTAVATGRMAEDAASAAVRLASE